MSEPLAEDVLAIPTARCPSCGEDGGVIAVFYPLGAVALHCLNCGHGGAPPDA
jgi:hypothetical protein